MSNILYSKKNLKKSFPKFFIKLRKPLNSKINSDIQKYSIKSRNNKPVKRENFTPFSFNKNSITKSTFYSKTNSSTKYDNNFKYILTEMNHTYSNLIKSQNNSTLKSSLFRMPNDKRKTFNSFAIIANNSISIDKKSNKIKYKLNDIRNISSILYPKNSEEKNSTILITNNNFDSLISNMKNNSTFNNITLKDISANKNYLKSGRCANLEIFLKDKFYEDVKEKFNKHFQRKKFEHDNSVKDKIIKLKQVSDFWGGVFSFMVPIISTKKYQCDTKLIENRKKYSEMNKKYLLNESIKNYYNLSEKKNHKRKIQNLYTISNFIRKRKKEIQEEKLNLLKKNKTLEQILYF